MRKGQISFFVILGLVLVSIIVGMVLYRQEVYSKLGEVGIIKEAALPPQVENIKEETQACLQYFGERAIVFLGLHGGYVELDSRIQYSTVFTDMFSDLDYQGTAHLYYEGQKKVPSLKTMETGIAKYISKNIKECQKEYTGFEIEYNTRYKPKVEIQDEKVSFDIAWYVKVTKDEKEYKIRDFKFDTPVALGKMYNVINEIVDMQVELKSEDVCLSCLTDISAENDVKIEAQGIEEDTIYVITDEKSIIAENFYIFVIANRF